MSVSLLKSNHGKGIGLWNVVKEMGEEGGVLAYSASLGNASERPAGPPELHFQMIRRSVQTIACRSWILPSPSINYWSL